MFKKSTLLLLVLSFLALTGCASEASAASQKGDSLVTQAMQTVEAMLTATQAAQPKPSATPTATPSLTPTLASPPAPAGTRPAAQPSAAVKVNTASQSACDVAGFVSDVTIPDGTSLTAGSSFTKTWELRNSGTCTWTTGYLLIFYSGSAMSGPATQQLTTSAVAPGQSLQVSVTLTAPSTSGTYTGYWGLRNASGANFGIGTGGSPFYVKIVVDSSSTATVTPTATEEGEETETPTETPTPTSQSAATSTTAPSATTQPTSTPLPTETPQPTATPVPTETPAPSASPAPSETPAPTGTASAE